MRMHRGKLDFRDTSWISGARSSRKTERVLTSFFRKSKSNQTNSGPFRFTSERAFCFLGARAAENLRRDASREVEKAPTLCALARGRVTGAFFLDVGSGGGTDGKSDWPARRLRAKMSRTLPRPLSARKRKVDYFELWLTARLKPCPAMRRWPVSDWVKS